MTWTDALLMLLGGHIGLALTWASLWAYFKLNP